MYRVIIIDDKPLICQALEKTIHWAEMGCTVVDTATDGIYAKQLVDKYQPQLVITDIRMPGLDGLELTVYIKEKLPQTQIIMITGYQEFEYAQRAIQLGVFDLVLKPIHNENMEQVIQKAIQKIKKEEEIKQKQKELLEENYHFRSEEKYNCRLRKKQFVMDLIQQRLQKEEIVQKQLDDFHMGKLSYWLVLGRVRSSDREKVAQILKEIHHILYENDERSEIFDMNMNEDLLILIPVLREQSVRENQIVVKNILRNIQDKIKTIFGNKQRICFVISQQIADIVEIKETYDRIYQILQASYFSADQDLVFSNNYQLLCGEKGSTIIQDLDGFYRKIEEGMKKNELQREIDMILKRIQDTSGGNEFKIKCLLSEMCITVLRYYKDRIGAHFYDIGSVMSDIDDLVDMEHSQKFLQDFLTGIQKQIQESKEIQNPIARDAIAYIKKNYKENFSLAELANYLNVNASYLSRLLKKETGNNFVELISAVRINVAKQLLLEPGSKVIEVGEQVGFREYAYFYQVFKKTEGISPSEYKKTGKKI